MPPSITPGCDSRKVTMSFIDDECFYNENIASEPKKHMPIKAEH
jgi:hypothetical protein